MTLQRYYVGDDVWEAEAGPETPVFLAGRHLYAIVTAGGAVRPFGEWHLRGKMGGVWAHPVRVLEGWSLALDVHGAVTPLDHAVICELFGSHATRRYVVAGIHVEWTEFAADDQPHYYATLLLRNEGDARVSAAVLLQAEADLRFCWFGGIAPAEPEMTVLANGVAWSAPGPYAGVTVTLMSAAPASWASAGRFVTARFPLVLNPGEAIALQLRLAVQRDDAPAPASGVLRAAVDMLSAKIAGYRAYNEDVRLATPDPAINQYWQVARQNLRMLVADYRPVLAPYFLAGLPEYPQLFGCDTEYTVSGAIAAGFADVIRSALEELGRYGWRGCGRIPHEITTNGRVFHPGNTQETPQFAVACRDYMHWTGDLAFLERMYPLCVEGLEHFDAILAGNGYPVGDGVVERLGMGACKLDSVCYLHQALVALQEMALALGRPDDAVRFASLAGTLAARFEADWWIEAEGMYADSLHLDGRPQFDGHWTVVLPAQTGIASPERARRTLERITREWVNEWGLVHTRGIDSQVWTLPTGLLALAMFRDGQADLGVRLLRTIGETARHGTLGTLKELIPTGLCFVQLWSAGLYIQGVVEGLFGVRPFAHRHELAVEPRLPQAWPSATLHGLRVGAHTVTLVISPESVAVDHVQGAVPLLVRYRGGDDRPWCEAQVLPGARATLSHMMHAHQLPSSTIPEDGQG